MKIIVNKRPKDSSECILVNKEYMQNTSTNILCLKNCATCQFIQTFEEYYDANNPEITNDGYDD